MSVTDKQNFAPIGKSIFGVGVLGVSAALVYCIFFCMLFGGSVRSSILYRIAFRVILVRILVCLYRIVDMSCYEWRLCGACVEGLECNSARNNGIYVEC